MIAQILTQIMGTITITVMIIMMETMTPLLVEEEQMPQLPQHQHQHQVAGGKDQQLEAIRKYSQNKQI